MALPRRFRPLLQQARAQAELQYGAPGDLLAMLLGQAGHDLSTSVRQARGGARVLEAGVDQARADLPQNFRLAGFDPAAVQGNPDMARLGQTLTGALNELDLRKLQAEEGAASGVRQAQDAYRQDAGKIKQQIFRNLSDRGTATAALLDQLISGDRSARRAARVEARKQSFTAEQNALDRATGLEKAYIGEGIDPTSGKPLPGSKAKGKAKPKLTLSQRNQALDQITSARGAFQQFSSQKGFNESGLRNGLRVGSLPTGDKPIKVPKVASDIYISAGFELAKTGKLSAATQRELRKRGLRIPVSWRPRDPFAGVPKAPATPRQAHGGPAGR